jgi:putative holliday junction resolvase
MRFLGIDYGTRRTGIALSDVDGSFAFPKEVLDTTQELPRRIAAIAKKEKVRAIVIGDTRSLAGEANEITADVEKFAQELASLTMLPIERAREAWSTFEAKRFAPPSKQHDDSAAAAIILQRYLDGLPRKE